MDREYLKDIARDARPDLDSYRNCSAINKQIYRNLINEDIDCEFIRDGKLSKYGMRGHGPEHSFVVVRDDEISKFPIIIDGALDQFSSENEKQGKTLFSIADESEIPEVVVLSKGDEWFDLYTL